MSNHLRIGLPMLGVLLLVASTQTTLSARRLVERLVIRVYDLAALDAAARTRAIDTAAGIVAEAGLLATWQDCRDAAARARVCESWRGEDDLVVRIVRTAAPRTQAHTTLGYAVIEPATGAGALATVFLHRVEEVARRSAASTADMLGRAVAHEVGHLLLGTNVHASSGLMRERWTDQEVFRNRADDWLFSSAESGRLRDQWPTVSSVARSQ